MANDDDFVDVTSFEPRRSAFDVKNHGIKPDPTKSYRWVDPKRIEERKFGDHYVPVKAPEGHRASDGTVRTKGGMVLMERPQTISDQRAKEKEARTRQRTQSAKKQYREDIEELSSRYGKNLHKHVTEDEG